MFLNVLLKSVASASIDLMDFSHLNCSATLLLFSLELGRQLAISVKVKPEAVRCALMTSNDCNFTRLAETKERLALVPQAARLIHVVLLPIR